MSKSGRINRNSETRNPKWLTWSQELQAIAQIGLQYNTNPFDGERYHALSRIASEIMENFSISDPGDVKVVFDKQSG